MLDCAPILRVVITLPPARSVNAVLIQVPMWTMYYNTAVVFAIYLVLNEYLQPSEFE